MILWPFFRVHKNCILGSRWGRPEEPDDQKCADRDSYPPHFSGSILRDVQVKIYTLDRRPTVEFLREGGDTMATLDQAQEPDKNYRFIVGMLRTTAEVMAVATNL